jgi:hypothetical protein
MKAYWGSGGIAPRILNQGTRWRWVVSFTPRPLYPQGKNPWYPLDRRVGGPQSRSERGGEDKNSKPLQGLEPPIFQPIAQRYTTELSRLPLYLWFSHIFHSIFELRYWYCTVLLLPHHNTEFHVYYCTKYIWIHFERRGYISKQFSIR